MYLFFILLFLNIIEVARAENNTVPIIIISITLPLIIATLILIYYIIRLENRLLNNIYRIKNYRISAGGFNNPIYDDIDFSSV